MSILEKFHYQITGPADAPKLVFLHGVMGFAANFRRIARAFEEEFQVLVYDQRGHGRSFHALQGEYAAENYAADLRQILEELGWKQAAVVGHSMGGRVAFHFASQHPEMVTRLVIEDIGPSMHPTGASLVLRMLDAVPVPFADKRAAKKWFDTDFLQLFKDERQKEGLAAYLYANITENERNEAVWRFSEAGIRASVANGREFERWTKSGP
jgi:pimeloyl-ACP methyl ester carboxylesterase